MSAMQEQKAHILEMLDRPVVMIGLMGAGKSKIGQELAKVLGLKFVDSDAVVVENAGMSVAEIFETQGEEVFREMERNVLKGLVEGGPKVIGTGGGAFMDEQTAALIKDKSVSIWLRADLDVLVERTAKKKTRPLLLTGNPREILQNLMDKRYPVYMQADIIVDSVEDAEIEDTLKSTVNALHTYLQETTLETKNNKGNGGPQAPHC